MTETIQNKSASRMPAWLKAVFALSLAGNLAVLGLLAGAALRGGEDGRRPRHAPPPPPPAAAEAIGGVMFRKFDPEERRALRALADGPYDNIVERRVAELHALLDLIRQEPLDLTALRNRIAEQSTAIQTFRSAMQEAWITKLEQMSPAERAAFADQVEKHIARFRKPPRRDGDHDQGQERGPERQ
ncbi:periplasmic heavy metal sensor [Phaeobacter sp. HF9A]|uniref:periplasmic heavy metal sensor n=1 Tax=Phaeobacter sp. HF9A TaxID=2721561 RepID=UPI0014309824|nr:periplasmic heavy metal sensor [Phaeobacter sp. HF9A]NIZ14705.1 periplasmic heavy metal sensor [Phaeobacter sp. HF9A]